MERMQIITLNYRLALGFLYHTRRSEIHTKQPSCKKVRPLKAWVKKVMKSKVVAKK